MKRILQNPILGFIVVCLGALIAGAGRELGLSKRLLLVPEVAISAARASVPVAGGGARTWNVALQGLVGVGYRF